MYKYKDKYIKYKTKYSELKNSLLNTSTLDLNSHEKISFIDFNILPNFEFGNKQISSLVLPHAGSLFVKDIMLYCFDQMNKDKFDKIVLLSTNHINSNNYILPKNITEIKFGEKTIKLDSVNLETKSVNLETNISDIDSILFYLKEHSFLSVLPYLEKFNLPLTIIIVGNLNDKLYQTLKEQLNEKTLLIANTDLLHCGGHFNFDCPSDINAFNKDIINSILNKNTDLNKMKKMCGFNTIQLLNRLINLNTTNNLIYSEYTYSQSQNITKDKGTSVGYTGIIFNKNGKPDLKNNKFLNSLPKITLEKHFSQHEMKCNFELELKDIVGIFVTIRKNKELRGCIGTFNKKTDIIETIIEYTINAAFHDMRFNKIEKDELSQLEFSINYLKKPFVISKTDLFKIFKPNLHGITLYFSDNTNSTYLASVMPEHFNINNLEQFKTKYDEIESELKRKANSNGIVKKIELYECEEI